MRIVEPSAVIHWELTPEQMLAKLERAGRTAWKSEEKIGQGRSAAFVQMLLERGHLSVLEHVSVSATVVCDRGISHELVRHRIASYTQESTRFCNYAADRFGHEITVIEPSGLPSPGARDDWAHACQAAEGAYFSLLAQGARAQTARSVLPTCLKTEVFLTFNLREWLHFFELRCAKDAHPDMQRIAGMLRAQFTHRLPVLFPVEAP